MKKFWWALVIIFDILVINLHVLWEHASPEAEWKVWDSSVAGSRAFLIGVILLKCKLDKWGELAVANYFAFSALDFVQTTMDKNHGFFIEELLAYLVLNITMVHKWKEQP